MSRIFHARFHFFSVFFSHDRGLDIAVLLEIHEPMD